MERRGRGERYLVIYIILYCDFVNIIYIILIYVLFILLMICDCERFFKFKNFICMYEFYFMYYNDNKKRC